MINYITCSCKHGLGMPIDTETFDESLTKLCYRTEGKQVHSTYQYIRRLSSPTIYLVKKKHLIRKLFSCICALYILFSSGTNVKIVQPFKFYNRFYKLP